MDTPWVIGQQGNIDGEFWKGLVAEIRVYDRGLSSHELKAVHSQLAKRYSIELLPEDSARTGDPQTLAMASLCHVLMNSNEFLFID